LTFIFTSCESDDNNDETIKVNVPPIAVDLSMAMNLSDGDTATITLAATDSDGDALTYSIVSQSSLGNVTIEGNKAIF